MRLQIVVILFLSLFFVDERLCAQNRDIFHQKAADSIHAAYEKFKLQAENDYRNFRDHANREYAEYVKQSWQLFDAQPAVPMPEEKGIPPIVINNDEKRKPVKDNLLSIEKDVITLPAPKPQPVPVAPIEEQLTTKKETVLFSVYGTKMKVRFNKEQRFSLSDCSVQLFDFVASDERRLKSDRYPDMDITSCVNKNLIAFYDEYPSSSIWDNFMTRWAMYVVCDPTYINASVGMSMPGMDNQTAKVILLN
ncbi:MAG: hypothetical protein IJV17_03125 [Prevotella sp.]|nr:hypothetical protein [Prevotella sp.]